MDKRMSRKGMQGTKRILTEAGFRKVKKDDYLLLVYKDDQDYYKYFLRVKGTDNLGLYVEELWRNVHYCGGFDFNFLAFKTTYLKGTMKYYLLDEGGSAYYLKMIMAEKIFDKAQKGAGTLVR